MEKLRAIEDRWFKVCVTVAIVFLVIASFFLFGVTDELAIAVAVAWLALIAVWLSHGGDVEEIEETEEECD